MHDSGSVRSPVGRWNLISQRERERVTYLLARTRFAIQVVKMEGGHDDIIRVDPWNRTRTNHSAC